jgi:CTP synthase
MEIVELRDHPFFVGVQYHPEYLSRVLKPSPPYLGFVAASAGLLGEVIAEVGNSGKAEVNGHAEGNGTLTNGVKKISLSGSGAF